jgi:hypothetical protein
MQRIREAHRLDPLVPVNIYDPNQDSSSGLSSDDDEYDG